MILPWFVFYSWFLIHLFSHFQPKIHLLNVIFLKILIFSQAIFPSFVFTWFFSDIFSTHDCAMILYYHVIFNSFIFRMWFLQCFIFHMWFCHDWFISCVFFPIIHLFFHVIFLMIYWFIFCFPNDSFTFTCDSSNDSFIFLHDFPLNDS